jgi:hypothetical protein
MRIEAASKKAKGPSHNPALHLPLVQLQVKPGAESRKARESTHNPAALRAGEHPLVVDKRNPRAERKKASKVLQLPLALNDANLIWIKQRPWSDPGPFCVHGISVVTASVAAARIAG